LFELGCNVSNPKYNDRADFSAGRMPQSTQEDFSPGQLVRHKVFGLGKVTKYIDMGENSIVEVKFNTGQTKSLMVQYAQLSKV
jgi:DNA helicase-2/ATP-dependent DNA helicase PcrA